MNGLPVPHRALAVAAHPDDAEFGAGATLAKWAAAGCEIAHVILTDGSKGTWDPGADTAHLVAVRQHEQRAAARTLGGGTVVFCGWPDGELEASLVARAQLCYWIRALRPEVVLGHDPWRRYRLHPDHRHAGFLLTDAVVAARDPHFFPDQGLPPHRPHTLLLWEADEPDHYEDVTDYVEVKLAALLEHRSQLRPTMGIEGSEDAPGIQRFRQRVLERLATWGAQAGVAYAEAFKRLTEL